MAEGDQVRELRLVVLISERVACLAGSSGNGAVASDAGRGAAAVSVVDETSAARVAVLMYLAWCFDQGSCLCAAIMWCAGEMLGCCKGAMQLPPVVASEMVCSVTGGADLALASTAESPPATPGTADGQWPTSVGSSLVQNRESKRQRRGASP